MPTSTNATLTALGALAAFWSGCGGGSSSMPLCPGGNTMSLAQNCPTEAWSGGALCNPCTAGACLAGAITGFTYASGADTTYTNSPQAMCTPSCSKDSDCQSLDYLAANGIPGSPTNTQAWTCKNVGGQSYCTVALEGHVGGGTPCQTCLQACRGMSDCCTGSGCICQGC